uniref:Uncharacterized protein n=1 Tax=Arion vulgaris TaxID=1028688 RepID=A0A0B7BX47_9EUPU
MSQKLKYHVYIKHHWFRYNTNEMTVSWKMRLGTTKMIGETGNYINLNVSIKMVKEQARDLVLQVDCDEKNIVLQKDILHEETSLTQ